MDMAPHENQDYVINGNLLKHEVWGHSGEHVLGIVHPGWLTDFVFEGKGPTVQLFPNHRRRFC